MIFRHFRSGISGMFVASLGLNRLPHLVPSGHGKRLFLDRGTVLGGKHSTFSRLPDFLCIGRLTLPPSHKSATFFSHARLGTAGLRRPRKTSGFPKSTWEKQLAYGASLPVYGLVSHGARGSGGALGLPDREAPPYPTRKRTSGRTGVFYYAPEGCCPLC